MKEGFYLSAFICINEAQNILDIKLRHNQTIALWEYRGQKLKLVKYWELERISGIKEHPKALFNKEAFNNLVSFLLSEENLTIDDIISIWGTKELETDRSYRTQFGPKFAFHSIAHLLTAIYFNNSNPFDDCILGMALDARPDIMFEEDAYEKLYYSACVIKDGNINWFPVESPARLWNYVYKKFGMREGTFMALCNAIETECFVPQSLMKEWSSYKFFDEEARYNSQEVVESISEYIYSIDENRIGIDCSEFDNRFSDDENRLSMIAKIINRLSLDMVFRNIDLAIERYNLDSEKTTIALAGGFALNCPTNTACLEKYNFCSYQIPPCASDTGIAMGIGIAGFFSLLKDKKVDLDISSAFYGQNVGNVEQAVENFSSYIQEARPCTMDEFVEYIIAGEVLVWVNGNAEIGPRALGNRSLIADARFDKSKDLLNIIKKRQWWRPVAPLILDEYGPDYFENYRTSPNMLVNLSVKDTKKSQIKAVVHFDGSARIQSVTEKDNPVLYSLLKKYHQKTGVPVLCNTSLNDAGEPIINKIDEAIEFALHKGLEFVCVNGNYLIRLKKSEKQLNKAPALRNREFFFKPEDFDEESYLKKLNPHNLTVTELTLYYDHPKEFSGLSLDSEECANKVRAYTKEFLKKYKHGMKR